MSHFSRFLFVIATEIMAFGKAEHELGRLQMKKDGQFGIIF
jgi:alkyl hydroperoxide reductase subunit AhpC